MDSTINQAYAKILSEMIKKETVSVTGVRNKEKFDAFHALLKELFPNLFGAADIEDFDGSLLLRWKGKSDSHPILLMSHHDVVEANAEDWKYPPFSGEIAEGKVWGRGTLDTKGSLMAMLKAADELIGEGFVPEHDVWFETACTEETDGSGADKITAALEKRGIRFDLVLDEGGMMLDEPLPGAKGKFAMIGAGEKGFADLKFIAKSKGGHASTPGKNTPLVRLGKFMAAVEKSGCFKAELSPVITEMFKRLAPYMSGPLGKIFSKADKMKWLLSKAMPMASPTAAALLRTTIAFTMSKGSDGRNVLPQEAFVVGNMRYSHHQGGPASIKAVSKIAAKYDIETEILSPGFASNVTDVNSKGFRLVEETVKKVFPEAVPVPYIMTGASDARYFSRVSDCCVRFAPFTISHEQMASIHGVDENVDASTLAGAVEFYRNIIKSA